MGFNNKEGMGMKKKIIILLGSLILISFITSINGKLYNMENYSIKIILNIFLNLLNGTIALISMKLIGIRLELDIKNKKQYFIGIVIALILSSFLAFLPTLFGISLVGGHIDFSVKTIIFSLIYYIFVIGAVEELIFRVYLQETFISMLKKNKWIGVILSSLVFGFWHLINGSLIQVVFTFFIGLIFGFSKYLIKDCQYLGLALGHGFYDFLNIVVRMLVI